MVELSTIKEVIKELGGPQKVAEMTKRTGSPSVVTNWMLRKKLPATTFTILKPELERRGFTAPNKLWGMP